jgi:anthranilate phosphoribosyltransferase
MSGQAAEAQIAGLLVGLAAKGTTVDELVGAASAMREKVIPIDSGGMSVVLDTCGTGGDIRHTFNISTAAALIAAGAGIKVVKHGNRSASSNCGAADVLEKLGLKLEIPPADLRRCLDRANICFAFARAHHPSMKFVAATRTHLGIPTIFNLLGPLTNPGRAKHQLLGVFAPELTDRLAAVLRELGSTRAWVVHAEDGLDEISTLGPTRISELRDGHIRTWTLDPKELGIGYARLSDLQISSLDEAANSLTSVLKNDPGPKRDIALLNAAAAIVIAEKAKDLKEGLEIARKSLDDGKAAKALELLIAESNR